MIPVSKVGSGEGWLGRAGPPGNGGADPHGGPRVAEKPPHADGGEVPCRSGAVRGPIQEEDRDHGQRPAPGARGPGGGPRAPRKGAGSCRIHGARGPRTHLRRDGWRTAGRRAPGHRPTACPARNWTETARSASGPSPRWAEPSSDGGPGRAERTAAKARPEEEPAWRRGSAPPCGRPDLSVPGWAAPRKSEGPGGELPDPSDLWFNRPFRAGRAPRSCRGRGEGRAPGRQVSRVWCQGSALGSALSGRFLGGQVQRPASPPSGLLEHQLSSQPLLHVQDQWALQVQRGGVAVLTGQGHDGQHGHL